MLFFREPIIFQMGQDLVNKKIEGKACSGRVCRWIVAQVDNKKQRGDTSPSYNGGQSGDILSRLCCHRNKAHVQRWDEVLPSTLPERKMLYGHTPLEFITQLIEWFCHIISLSLSVTVFMKCVCCDKLCILFVLRLIISPADTIYIILCF